MAANEIHKYDIGTVFRFTVKYNGSADDISDATTRQVTFQKPSGTKVTKTLSLVNDGTDGLVQYTTVADDLDEIGTWKAQCYIVYDDTQKWYTDIITFKVHRNL